MWWWLAAFVVSLLVTYAVMSMIPKPETGKPPEVEEFDGPTTIDGREITVLFGTRNFPDLQVHWWGDVRTGPRYDDETGDILIGYHYYVGMHLIACLGPVDFLSFIWVDERPLYYSPTGEFAGGSILVDNLDLFGGPAGEGGVKGYIDVEMGLPTQGRNSYLEHNLDGGDAPGDFEAHDIPAFRGVVGLILKSIYVGHTPYLKKWMIRLQRIHLRQDGIDQWYDAKAEIPLTCGDAVIPIATYDREDFIVVIPNHNDMWNDPTGTPTQTAELVALRQGTVDFIKWARAKYAPYFVAGGEWPDYEDEYGTVQYMWLQVSHYSFAANSTKILPTASDSEFNAFYSAILNKGPDPYEYNWSEYAKAMQAPRQGGAIFYSRNDSFTTYFSSYVLFADDPDPPAFVNTIEEDVADAVAWIEYIDVIDDVDLNHFSINSNYENTVYTKQLDTVTGIPLHIPATVPLTAAEVTQTLIDLQLAHGADIVDDGGYDANDINPSHIIRECLTDPDWGISGDESSPDEAAFVYAADYLYNENMGISLKWTSQSDIEEFIELVKKHINAELYPDHATGKFILKLIRDDYNVTSLTVLGESDIVKVENAKRPLIGDLVNSVTVQYWDTCIGEDSSVTVQDSALIHMQGKEINTTVQYPGFTYKDIAVRVATRDLRALSSQLLSCTLYAKRTAEGLNLGSVFVMHWPDLEISGVVMRVQDIDFGDGRKNTIKIDAVEDVFGLPATVVVGDDDNDPSWKPPIQDAIPLVHELAVETPYYELLQKYGGTELTAKLSANPDLGYALTGGVRVTNSDIDAVISADNGSGYIDVGRMDLCGSVEITADVDQIEKVWGYTRGIDLDRMEIGTHAQIDDELIVIEAITQTNDITGTITVGRAVLDTSPRTHAAGSRLIAWDEYNYTDLTEYDDGDTVSLKIRPTTGHGTLALADAAALSVAMDSRALRPYPPADLQVDGSAYPTDTIISTSIDVTWAQRNRLTQTALLDHTSASVTDEAGCAYTIYVIDSSDVTQITITGETGTSKTVDLSSLTNIANYTLQVWAVRNSIDSWQCVEWAFVYGFNDANYQTLVESLNPVAYWRMGEAIGSSAAIDLVSGQNATYINSPALESTGLIAGDADNAVLFASASSEYARYAVSNFRGSDASGTICAWIKLTTASPGVGQNVLSSADEASTTVLCILGINGDDLLAFTIRGVDNVYNNFTSTNTIADTDVHFIAVTSDGSTIKLYIDGVEETVIVDAGSNTGQWFNHVDTLRDNVTIGALRRTTVSGYVNGVIDEVAIFDTTLSSTQIASLYDKGT